ncbi:MAG: type I-D CRISPR-associated helicase Cas3' [Desulfitobacteriaceae bacterium]
MSELRISPLVLPLIEHRNVQQKLYPHQSIMLDEWDNHDAFMVVTKTGTGKTISAVLPILKRRLRAICVYPTNELIADQVRNIALVAERENLRVGIFTPESSPEEYSKVDVVLIHIDAYVLEKWCKKKHWREKWRAIIHLLEADKPKIILTNPDILFMIFALRYHAEALALLQGYDALIVDEFHLYTGVELAHALFMLHMGRSLGAFGKIVLLTATPAPGVEELSKSILGNPLLVDLSLEAQRVAVDERQAVQSVQVIPRLSGDDVIETSVTLVKELLEEILKRRNFNPRSDYVPAVIILNSVVSAIRLEDRLVEEGFKREDMAIIRGLSARGVRSIADKLVVIGTSAIEVGIDFQCDFLIFEANDAASFIQRFGRVGRHAPGVAYVLCQHNVVVGIDTLSRENGGSVARGLFEERIYSWYPALETRAWFTRTLMGLLTAFSLGENLQKRVQRDNRSNSEQIAYIESEIERFYCVYSQKLGCSEKQLSRVLIKIRKARQGIPSYAWINAYRDLNTFRTSMPTEWVLDFSEKKRRGDNWEQAKYKVDVNILLHRAEGLRFNVKIPNSEGRMGILTLQGYGAYKRVWVMPTFDDDDCGIIFCSNKFPDLVFMVNDVHRSIPAQVSRVMTYKNHIFTVVPRGVLSDLDWRIPVFECGQHVIGFDGVALLLYELYDQTEDD